MNYSEIMKEYNLRAISYGSNLKIDMRYNNKIIRYLNFSSYCIDSIFDRRLIFL